MAKRETIRLLLFQLVEARRTLQAIMVGEKGGKEAAEAYFFRFVYVSKDEVDAFFASEEGAKVLANLGL